MRKKYVVGLTKEERERLLKLIRAGEAPARMLNRARILLKADRGEHAGEGPAPGDREIAGMLETSSGPPWGRVRERFFRQGPDAALERSAPDRLYERTFDGRAEARLIALVCSEAPEEGRDRWSMRLLADKAVELGIVESVSHETVRKALKKRAPPPPRQGMGDRAQEERGFRPADGETVLDLYEEPHDPLRPVVCFDERPCQLLAEAREPLAGKQGSPKRRDHEYERRGMANVPMAFDPLVGWRGARVVERRRGREFAEAVRHTWWRRSTRTRNASAWCATTSPPTQRPPSTRPSRRRKRSVWPAGSSSSTRRCTARG